MGGLLWCLLVFWREQEVVADLLGFRLLSWDPPCDRNNSDRTTGPPAPSSAADLNNKCAKRGCNYRTKEERDHFHL